MKTQVFLSIAILVAVFTSSCSSDKNKITLEGKVKRETISIAPKLAGRIAEIRVKESDIAHKGDTLAIIDIPEVQAKIQQAEGAVLAAGSQYQMASNGATKDQKDQVVAMYKSAQEQYLFAEKSLKRVQNMYNDSLISPQAYDEALAKYNVARSQYDAAAAKKQEVTGGLRDEQVHMALGQKHQAEGALQEARIAYNERIIIAPKDMTIETIALHEGELALPGYNIFIGYEINSTYFRFTVSESMVQNFKRDSIYNISLPFFNGKNIHAKLCAINELGRYAYKTTSYPNYQMGEAVYELKLIPENKKVSQQFYVNGSAILEKSLTK
jgi:HlyD family secretion protein